MTDNPTPQSKEKEDPRDLIGLTLDDRYRIDDIIGQGGMGVVYRAFNIRFNKEIAVKVLSSMWSSENDAVKRFVREAWAAFEMNHPNLVKVYDLGLITDKRPYFAMELCQGEPISSIIERECRIDIGRAVDFIRQAATALDAVHEFKIYHRDIKPENLMVIIDKDGKEQIKLLDFGIAAFAGDYSMAATQLTRTGQMQGTPQYLAPEIAQGGRPDARSDVYSLAVVAFEILTSKIPFESNNPIFTLTRKCNEAPPFLAEILGVPVPNALEEVLQKALATLPDDRYNTPGEFATELMLALHREAHNIPATLLSVGISEEGFIAPKIAKEKRESLPTMFNARELAIELLELKKQGKLHPPQKRALPFPPTSAKTPAGHEHTPRSGRTVPLDLSRSNSVPDSLELSDPQKTPTYLSAHQPVAIHSQSTPPRSPDSCSFSDQDLDTLKLDNRSQSPSKNSVKPQPSPPNHSSSATPNHPAASTAQLPPTPWPPSALLMSTKKQSKSAEASKESENKKPSPPPSSTPAKKSQLPQTSLLANVPGLNLEDSSPDAFSIPSHSPAKDTDNLERQLLHKKGSSGRSFLLGIFFSLMVGVAALFSMKTWFSDDATSAISKEATAASPHPLPEEIIPSIPAMEQGSQEKVALADNTAVPDNTALTHHSVAAENKSQKDSHLLNLGSPTLPSSVSGERLTKSLKAQQPSTAAIQAPTEQQKEVSLVAPPVPPQKSDPKKSAPSSSSNLSETTPTQSTPPSKEKTADSLTKNGFPVHLIKASSKEGIARQYAKIGRRYLIDGQKKYAIHFLKKATQTDPKNHEAWFQLARAYESSGQKKSAIHAYEKNVRLSPKGYRAKDAKEHIEALNKWFKPSTQ